MAVFGGWGDGGGLNDWKVCNDCGMAQQVHPGRAGEGDS